MGDDWSDLVTTALLGTGRRPLPADLPEQWGSGTVEGDDASDAPRRVLALAARHRAVVRAAPTPPARSALPVPAPAPADDRGPAPGPAAELLVDLLLRPSPDLVNLWLERADAVGVGIPAASWTRLARLAAHASAYDRPLLGRVLGARGRWFLEQNPEWRRLAADCAGETRRIATGPPAPPSPETIRGKPLAIFDHPDPWPDEVVAAAFAVVGSGGLGRRARDYAGRVGGRLPTRLYPTVARAAEYYLLAPEATPAQRRLIKECFVMVEQAAFARVRIERAFGTDAADQAFRRIEIPGV